MSMQQTCTFNEPNNRWYYTMTFMFQNINYIFIMFFECFFIIFFLIVIIRLFVASAD